MKNAKKSATRSGTRSRDGRDERKRKLDEAAGELGFIDAFKPRTGDLSKSKSKSTRSRVADPGDKVEKKASHAVRDGS